MSRTGRIFSPVVGVCVLHLNINLSVPVIRMRCCSGGRLDGHILTVPLLMGIVPVRPWRILLLRLKIHVALVRNDSSLLNAAESRMFCLLLFVVSILLLASRKNNPALRTQIS